MFTLQCPPLGYKISTFLHIYIYLHIYISTHIYTYQYISRYLQMTWSWCSLCSVPPLGYKISTFLHIYTYLHIYISTYLHISTHINTYVDIYRWPGAGVHSAVSPTRLPTTDCSSTQARRHPAPVWRLALGAASCSTQPPGSGVTFQNWKAEHRSWAAEAEEVETPAQCSGRGTLCCR